MGLQVFLILGLIATSSVTICKAGFISDSLIGKMTNQPGRDVIVQLPSVMGAVLSNPALSQLSGPMKTDMLVSLLQQATTTSQAPFMRSIQLFGAGDQATPFWISNKIAITNASPALLSFLSLTPGLFTIRKPQKVKLPPIQPSGGNASAQADEVQWGVKKIGAPSVWASKTKGEGVVVANIDTGVNRNHQALKGNYRGGAGGWYDAVNGYDGPYDDQGHGTHTMGTICGTTRGIGVAPGAKWIACKGLDKDGSGSEQSLSACAQWILKPNNDAKLKPQVVSNSWGGGQGLSFFDDEIQAWKAADIIPIFSIGNSGSKCATANSPGDRGGLISVGSTNSDDTVSSFSSRGKSKDGKMKPEVSAPGGQILSAGYKAADAYVTMSGTSMAAPHVAGATALLIAGKSATTFNQILEKLETTAARPSGVTRADLSCGTTNGEPYPNNAYGYGRIDVKKASGL